MKLSSRYKRADEIVSGIAVALTGSVTIRSIGAMLLVSGVPGLTVEVISGILGIAGVIGVGVSRMLKKKALKHEANYRLASAKLDTIHKHVTDALADSIIGDYEYKLIVDKVEKYKIMVNEIRFGLHKKEEDSD